jgi:hypothetical protein
MEVETATTSDRNRHYVSWQCTWTRWKARWAFDAQAGADHNQSVLRQLRAAIVGLSLAACLAFSAALPQAHRHDADAHHQHATVHQHFASHDHDGAELSPDDDGPVTWFERVAVHRAATSSFAPLAVVAAYLENLPVGPSRWVAVEILDTAPPHGPPRRSLSLRAPPALPSAL